MPTPDGSSAHIRSSFTSNSAVNSLLVGTQWASKSISYSFSHSTSYWSTDPTVGYGDSTGSGEPWSDYYSPLSSSDINAVRTALKSWSDVSKLTFNEVADNSSVVGDIRFAYTYTDAQSNSQAWAYYPLSTPSSGDVWFNALSGSGASEWSLGSYEYVTLIHELGHALGLKHPFSGSGYNKQIIPPNLDARMYTVMSYTAYPDTSTHFSYEPTTPMVLDIAAIQHLYGANTSYHSGNNNYVFSEQSIYNETIWDAGGTDTFTYNSSKGGTINLTAGIDGGSLMGLPVYINDSFGNSLYNFYSINIAVGVVIENATGGSGNDVITGNAANNILIGGLGNDVLKGVGGNDTLKGGGGLDTVSYVGATAGVTVNLGLTSAQNTGGAGTDTLQTIENISGTSFNDKITGSAGNNIISGGRGNDTLTGKAGLDSFVINTPLNGVNNKDLITDFSPADDVIQLENSIMTSLGSATGTLKASKFFVGSAPHDTDDSIIYNKSTGGLYYDADGTGAASSVLVATIGTSTHPSLTYADFWVI